MILNRIDKRQFKVRYFLQNLNQDAAYYWLANLITVVFQISKRDQNLNKLTGKQESRLQIANRRGLRQR